MDAGQHDHIGIDGHRLARQSEAVADDIRDAVEDLGRLVVMRQDDGVAAALELEDRLDIPGEDRPFSSGDHPAHPFIEILGSCPSSGKCGHLSYTPYEHKSDICLL